MDEFSNDAPRDDDRCTSDAEPLEESQVRKIARLSRLSPSDAEIGQLRHHMAAVLDHAACLARADLDDVEPMSRPIDETNRLADDTPGPVLPREVLERMAPRMRDGEIEVPRVLGSEGGGA